MGYEHVMGMIICKSKVIEDAVKAALVGPLGQ